MHWCSKQPNCEMFWKRYNSWQMLNGFKVPKKYYTHGGVVSRLIGFSDNVTKEFLQWGTEGVY